MITKKFLQAASLAMLISIALPASSTMSGDPLATRSSNIENTRVEELVQRLKNIKEIDKSELTRLERKALRKEVKGIKKEMKEISGGVYLSVGAIIIVILLLILLL